MPYPKGNPRHRVPAVSPRDTRPTARFIEDNIVLCVHRLRRCHADCFPPSPAALRLPALWQSSRHLAGILPASRPRRRLKSMAWKDPGAARQRRAAEFLSRRTRRKPAGALRIPARRQFTFPVKPDAPRPNQTRIQAHILSGCLCTSLHRIRGDIGLHKVCTDGFLAHELHTVFFPLLPTKAQFILVNAVLCCYLVGNENTKRGKRGKW